MSFSNIPCKIYSASSLARNIEGRILNESNLSESSVPLLTITVDLKSVKGLCKRQYLGLGSTQNLWENHLFKPTVGEQKIIPR